MEKEPLSPLELMTIFHESKFMVVHFDPNFLNSNESPVIIRSKWAEFDCVDFQCFLPPEIRVDSKELQTMVLEDFDADKRTWKKVVIEHIVEFNSKKIF